MAAPKLTQAEKDFQLSRPNETSVAGLTEYRIAGLVIVELAVVLRMWGRKKQNIALRSDDYTLIIAALFLIGYAVCGVLSVKYGYGHHTLIVRTKFKDVFPIRAKAGYAANIIYTICFPVSRISLVLLYKRVFIKRWFKTVCWFVIFAYTCYSISVVLIDAFGTQPIHANWNTSIKPRSTIDLRKVTWANCIFNITSDVILLVLPLTIIWTLHMTKLSKLGLSFVFCLGALTLVASIMRFYYSLTQDVKDPEFSGAPGSFWTITELYLGLLCPCLVTFQPVLITIYRTVFSRLSPHNRERVSKLTGVDPSTSPSDKAARHDEKAIGSAEASPTQINASEVSSSLHSKGSDIEAQKSAVHHEKPSQASTLNDGSEIKMFRDVAVNLGR